MWNKEELSKYLLADGDRLKILALQSEKAFENVMMNVARQFLGHEPSEADAGRLSRVRRFDVDGREQILGDGRLLGEITYGCVYDEARQANYYRIEFVPA